MNQFDRDGFLITGPLLDAGALARLEAQAESVPRSGPGTRNLLQFPWCAQLAAIIRVHPLIRPHLAADAVAVQCTFFEKSREQNWLVPAHQDLSIPVKEKMPHSGLSGWSEKEGTHFVQPPVEVLEQLVAIRLHLDDCSLTDGPLRVVPGSHRSGRIGDAGVPAMRDDSGEVACAVQAGAALLMKPLLLHASSKASGQSRRRVLHFVFGAPVLPFGLRWQYAV